MGRTAPNQVGLAIRELDLKIAGVNKLRITVDYGQDLDLGDHVIFAEARVSK